MTHLDDATLHSADEDTFVSFIEAADSLFTSKDKKFFSCTDFCKYRTNHFREPQLLKNHHVADKKRFDAFMHSVIIMSKLQPFREDTKVCNILLKVTKEGSVETSIHVVRDKVRSERHYPREEHYVFTRLFCERDSNFDVCRHIQNTRADQTQCRLIQCGIDAC